MHAHQQTQALEKTIEKNYRHLKGIVANPAVPSTFQIISGVVKFSTLCAVFYTGFSALNRRSRVLS